MKKVLAVASTGGHWVQLMRLCPVWQDCKVSYITTSKDARVTVPGRLHVVADANRWERLKMALMFLQVAKVLLIERPDVVITTGAAPGLAAVALGRLVGAKTIWVDSIANSEELSGSGRIAKRFASVCLTQWPHLAADKDGVEHWGAVL